MCIDNRNMLCALHNAASRVHWLFDILFSKTVNNCIFASDLLLKYPLNKKIYQGAHSVMVKSMGKCSTGSWKCLSNYSLMDFVTRFGNPICWWITVLVMS